MALEAARPGAVLHNRSFLFRRFLPPLLPTVTSLVCDSRTFLQTLPMPYFFSDFPAIQNLTPPSSPTQPVRPDSPILPLTPAVEAEAEITDKGPNVPQVHGAERPKLRKRRSSLTVNTSPLVQLKGSYRGATIATQRQNRSRSGSVNDFSSQPRPIGFPLEEVKATGRLRSGSIGNSLRCVALGLFTRQTRGVLMTCVW